jgi:hypothetical protein
MERSSVEEDGESKDTFGNPRKYLVSLDSEMKSDFESDSAYLKIEWSEDPAVIFPIPNPLVWGRPVFTIPCDVERSSKYDPNNKDLEISKI